ncbi:MAG: hypothetical protein AAGF94_13015 [Pseudomonadota bacterium]
MRKIETAALETGLSHILAAPKGAGRILRLCYRPHFSKRVYPEMLDFCPQRGVEGDRWAEHSWLRLPDGQPDPQNQVCILPLRTYELICQFADDMPDPGDTIIADWDMTEANLPAGGLISAGSAVLRVSALFNDACTKWRVRYGQASYDWINREDHRAFRLRGMFCSVEKPGRLHRDDALTALANQPAVKVPEDLPL